MKLLLRALRWWRRYIALVGVPFRVGKFKPLPETRAQRRERERKARKQRRAS